MTFWSDFCGLISAVLLLIAPVKDQIYRLLEFLQLRRGETSKLKGVREHLADVWRGRRDAYSGWDSFWLTLGALLLFVSFGLKLAGH